MHSHLFACDSTTSVFTDHQNLVFTFHPMALDSSLGRHKEMKVIRWHLPLSRFTYTIEPVPGNLNSMADIMTRWMRGYHGYSAHTRRFREFSGHAHVIRAPDPTANDWPTRSLVLKYQKNTSDALPDIITETADGLIETEGITWIPTDAYDLQGKLLAVAHAGAAGHLGVETTINTLPQSFCWKDMLGDTKDFVAGCIFCLLSKSGTKVPRPLASTLHGARPNQVINFEYPFWVAALQGKYMYSCSKMT